MKYAFVEYGGQVLGIEDRCSCRLRSEKQDGELAIEDIVHPDFVYRYVEIPEGTEVAIGMIYSDGKFRENPVEPGKRIAELEERADSTDATILSIMDAVVAMQQK